MKDAYSEAGARVMAILAVGVFFNALARVPFALLQAEGRADITGRTNLAEILPYLLFLWLACSKFGIEGAAFAWSLRMLVDAIILFVIVKRRHRYAGKSNIEIIFFPFLILAVAVWTSMASDMIEKLFISFSIICLLLLTSYMSFKNGRSRIKG
jgi:O-antigen/teichoic acid export membrane protein